jgi:SAM-dependent methyltransferase
VLSEKTGFLGQACTIDASCSCGVHLVVTLLPIAFRDRQAEKHCRRNIHGTLISARPLQCSVGGHIFQASSFAVPLADASCVSIQCRDVLEYVRDDEALIAEFARVLKPGGRLTLRVPNAGPLAGIDSLNLYRYLVDITRRGRQPAETTEVGWRRHYSVADLRELLEPDFRLCTIATHGLGLAQIVDFVALATFRWRRRSGARYQRWRTLARRIERIGDLVRPGRYGWAVEVTAVRQTSA